MAKTYSKFNESTDVTIQPEFQSKILAYAAKRIKDSGAVVLADIKDIITFNDPLDGMISFSYLDTLAEDYELSEDGGYQYIEDAVSDISDYIQQQGYTLDPDSDDPLIFVDDRYDDADVDIEESSMNESTLMNESVQVTKPSSSEAKNHYIDKDGSTMIQNKDLGFYVIVGNYKDEDDDEYYPGMTYVYISKLGTSKVSIDKKKINEVLETTFDNRNDANAMLKELSKVDSLEKLAVVLRKYEFCNSDMDTMSGQRGFISMLEEGISRMNESTYIMNEAASIKKSDRYREFDLLPKGKGWVDPVELTNKDAGFYAIAGTTYDSTDPSNQNEWGVVLYLVPLDKKYEDIVICGSFYDYEESSYHLMDKLAKAKTPQDVARIIKNQEFTDDYGDDETEFIGALTKSYNAQNESTYVMNESAKVESLNPKDYGLMIDKVYPDGTSPLCIDNDDLEFTAIAWRRNVNKAEYSIELLFDNGDRAFSTTMKLDHDEAVSALEKLGKLSKVSDLDKAYKSYKLNKVLTDMNEYTEVPDGRMTVELDDEDVTESDTHLLAELTDEVFQAINTVMDELDPDADLSVIEDTEDKLVIEVVSDEDLDDDAFDEVLSELLEDIDLENIVADMTDSTPITDPADEDFGRVVQYINFYEINGDTVTPSGATMEDNLGYIEDEDVINESFNIKTSLTEFLSKLADEFKKEFKSNPDVEETSFSFDKKGKDKVFIQAIADSVNPGSRALSNYLRFLDENGVEYKTLHTFEYYKGALNCTIYTTIKITDIKDEEIMNESVIELESGRKVHYYVDDLNFKAGVKFLEDESAINKVLKAISSKASVEDYGLDKLPWVTYKTEEGYKVAVFYESPVMPYKMSIAIGDGKNLSDFISNAKSILVFNNLKKLDDWNNINIIVRIINNLAKVTDRASEYKAIKSLLSNYEKQVYNYAKYDESFNPLFESYYKDTDEDLSIDQAKINKALKVIDRILTKAGYPLDNLDKVYRFNYPRPGLVEINLINTLNSTYGFMGNKAYDIDTKIERKLESLNLTYASKDKSGKEIYTDDDKLVHYMSNELSKYIKTGKVPDREYSRNMVSAVHPKLEDIAKDITKYIESHPKYKKFNLYEYPPVHAGADWIKVKVRTEDIQDGKDILIDTDKYIAKNHKDLYHRVASKSSVNDKKYPFIEYSTAYTPKHGEGTLMWSNYEMRGSSIKDLMNESTNTPKLPTQKELQAIIQKSMIKSGEGQTRVTVHAYRSGKYENGVVEVDLDNTSLATDGREDDYYNEDDIRNSLKYAVKELVDKFGQDKDLLDYIDVQYNRVGSLTITFSLDSEFNESTKFDFDNLEEVIEEDLDSAIDLPDYADCILVYCYPTGQGYGVKVTLDERLVSDNKLHIIDRITKVVIDRCGKDYDLDQKRNKSKGEYYLTYSYKGSPFNECTLYSANPDNTDYNQSRKDSLAKAMITDQPLVDEYDIRCTIRPVFIRKGQYLYDGSTVYRTTSDAKLDEESGLYDIKVDVLLSNDDALAEPSTTISYSADFTGLKLLKSNPVKPYNESTDPKKVATVNMSFSNEDDAKDFIKDNGLDPVKSYQGKFGWVVEVKKSELKVK